MSKSQIRYLTLAQLETLSTISVEEAAHLIGISRQGAYDAVNRGDLPVVRLGRRVRVLAKPLHNLLVGTPNVQA